MGEPLDYLAANAAAWEFPLFKAAGEQVPLRTGTFDLVISSWRARRR
jgi:hypothetical protein